MQVHVREQLTAVKALGQLVNHEHILTGPAVALKPEVNGLFIHRLVHALQFLQPLFPAFRRADGFLTVEGTVARDNGFLTLDLLLLQLPGLHADFKALRALLHIVRIVPVIALHGPEDELRHVIAHMVHEQAVMGNDEHRAFPGPQIVFQPGNGLEVQMVRGLVQKQELRLTEQHAAQAQARALAAGEQSRLLRLLLLPEPETRQHALHGTAPAIAIGLLKRAGQAVIPTAQPAQRGLVPSAFRHFLLQAAQFLFHAHHRLKHAFHFLEHRALRVHDALLGQVPELQPALHGNGSAVLVLNARYDFHERGFSASVDAHQAQALAGLERHADVLEHFIGAEGLLHMLKGQENHGTLPFRVP